MGIKGDSTCMDRDGFSDYFGLNCFGLWRFFREHVVRLILYVLKGAYGIRFVYQSFLRFPNVDLNLVVSYIGR